MSTTIWRWVGAIAATLALILLTTGCSSEPTCEEQIGSTPVGNVYIPIYDDKDDGEYSTDEKTYRCEGGEVKDVKTK